MSDINCYISVIRDENFYKYTNYVKMILIIENGTLDN